MNLPMLPRRRALFGLSLTFLALTNPSRAADAGETRTAILALEKKYDEAYNKGDAAALASLYLDDAQILSPDKDPVKGRPAIQEHWQAEIKTSVAAGEKNYSEPLEIEDHGSVAHETGKWFAKKADGTVMQEGRYFVLWKKKAGQWKIYRETWNLKPKPERK